MTRVFQGIFAANVVEESPAKEFYEEDDPEANVRVVPAWMPPLVNFTSGMCLFQWFRFTFNNDYDIDLTECGKEIQGRLPVWLLHSEESLSEIFNQVEMVSEEDDHRWCEALHPNVDWALKKGLAPGQPFLVEFEPPRISGGGTDYNGDYNDVDIDYMCRIIRVMPKSRVGVLKAWEQALRRLKHEHVKHDQLVRHFTQQGMARKAHWRISKRLVASTIELKLVVDNPGDAAHTILRMLEIAKGSDSTPDPKESFFDKKVKDIGQPSEQYKRAFDNLLQDFIQKHPHEDVAPVLALSEAEYSSWDYLSLMECR